MPIILQCTVCGKDYRATPSRAVDSKYCSMACKHTDKGGTVRQCEYCGKDFYRAPSVVHNGVPQRYCSKKCYGRGRSKGITFKPRLHTAGYYEIWMPGHPRATNGYVFVHTLVAEQKVGRPLAAGEQVHHVNGVKTDNRPENLQVLTAAEHGRLHMAQKGGGAVLRTGKRKEAKE